MADIVKTTPAAPARREIYYPESDEQPVGETDVHISVMLYLRQALRYFFRDVEDIYVAANMFLYYQEGDPSAQRAPDVFVVKGVPKFDRRTYKLWEEMNGPCTVFEITSPSTRVKDFGEKKGLYQYLNVEEYFLFDPLDEYLNPQFQGFRLSQGLYEPMIPESDGTIFSEHLGAIFKPEGRMLRVVDPATGEALPTHEESLAEAHSAAEQATAEAERANTAEAEIVRLRAELEKLRSQSDKDS